jgi:hypothetical protein
MLYGMTDDLSKFNGGLYADGRKVRGDSSNS